MERKWKENGKPKAPHLLFLNRKCATRDLRRAQRQCHAISRLEFHQHIINASENDQSLFCRIVNKQRNGRDTRTKELILDGVSHTDQLQEIWREHFSRLAAPQINPFFIEEYSEVVENDKNNIKDMLAKCHPVLSIPITKTEVSLAISKLKKNKAADEDGLTAEHFLYAQQPIVTFLTPLINRMIIEGNVPLRLKGGLTHPIPKKGKPNNIPGNARGISITPVIGKILDSIIQTHQETVIENMHLLQFGFTKVRKLYCRRAPHHRINC